MLGPPLARGSWKNDQPRSHQSKREDSSKTSVSYHSGNFTSNAFLRPKDAQEYRQEAPDDSTTPSDDEFGAESVPRSRLRIWSPSERADIPSDETSARSLYSLEDEMSTRFHGKSSFFPLIQATRKLACAKSDDSFNSANGDVQQSQEKFPDRRREAFWMLPPVRFSINNALRGITYLLSSVGESLGRASCWP